ATVTLSRMRASLSGVLFAPAFKALNCRPRPSTFGLPFRAANREETRGLAEHPIQGGSRGAMAMSTMPELAKRRSVSAMERIRRNPLRLRGRLLTFEAIYRSGGGHCQ